MNEVSIFWFRRDLRLEDNHGLYEALKNSQKVVPVFIFDKNILDKLPDDDHRVNFLFDTLIGLNEQLKAFGSSLCVLHGDPQELIPEFMQKHEATGLYINRDYEPYARKRDSSIEEFCKKEGVDFFSFKDQVIFETDEIVKSDGTPYVVYTPYKNKWRTAFHELGELKEYNTFEYRDRYMKDVFPSMTRDDLGVIPSSITAPKYRINKELVLEYLERRDFPAQDATSYLSTYLRFGLVSIRQIVKQAEHPTAVTFLNELVWREFFMQILWHFPYTKDRAFRERYDGIQCSNNLQEFEKWKKGETGFPLVDAGIRELNATGFMHNRVRMVVASFLCKDLLIDWRWGEQYFAEKLFDYEMSSNVGNWQWAAGTGVDAAPYFRIFNPQSQMEKFDPNGVYVKKWVPEFFGIGYVLPMVDHKEARLRTLDAYKEAIADYKNNL